MEKYLKLNDIEAYKKATGISDYIWALVDKWDWFNKRTLGVQWVDSTDSIGGNIAEGFGRYHKKDKQSFYYIARGSAQESIHWTGRAFKRMLINNKHKGYIIKVLKTLPREINYLIKITQIKLKK